MTTAKASARSAVPLFWRLIFVPCALAGAQTADAQGDPSALQQDLPPAGYGTLRQDDVSLRLRTPTLQVQVVPLDERVIRLLAADTYQSLHRLVESKATEVAEAAARFGLSGEPTLLLVTFFGLQASARFDPEVIAVESQNRLFRPVAVLPLSPRWSGQQLSQRETASAIYLFESGVRILDPFVLSYESARTDAWEQIIRTLERERTSALARAARGGR